MSAAWSRRAYTAEGGIKMSLMRLMGLTVLAHTFLTPKAVDFCYSSATFWFSSLL